MTQVLHQMGQSIQEWAKQNLWKTTFKKFEEVCFYGLLQADHTPSNFLKALFTSQ